MSNFYVSPAIENHFVFELDGYILESSSKMGGNNMGSTGQEIGGEYGGGDDSFNHDWE